MEIISYLDFDYSDCIWTLLLPVILTFTMPVVFRLFLCFTAILLYIYKLYRFATDKTVSSEKNYWNVARTLTAYIWDRIGAIYHGYDIIGMENLPQNSSALIVYYHGALPIDLYYFVAKIWIERHRLVHNVGDRLLDKFPGWGIISEAMNVTPGTIQSCTAILNDGHLLAVSPGGAYEAQCGNNCYDLLWRKRIGFAKVAIEAKAPIVPMFTKNLREGFRTIGFCRRMFINFYTRTRLPLLPVFGGLPVKLRTYLGKPIPYDPNVSPEELREKVALAINDLINKHQHRPGSMLHALMDRLTRKQDKTECLSFGQTKCNNVIDE